MSRKRAIEAWNLLNDFVASLAAGTGTIHLAVVLESQLQTSLPYPEIPIFLFWRKMALRYIVLYLYKWHEFYKRYKSIIPEPCLGDFKKANDEIVKRGVVAYRNKCVGHIYDNSKRRPLTDVEEDQFINQIIRGDAKAFLKWVNSGPPRDGNQSLFYLAERTRNQLATTWSLSNDELGLVPGSSTEALRQCT